MSPRVSVVMTAYNAAWCVERALESVCAQTRLPDEILVCDDGSSDGTPDLIERRFGEHVTVLRLPHRNAAASRRVGLERASGNWLAFMDADDTWRPKKQELQLAFLERHPEVRWISCDGAFVSADGVIRESWLSDYFEPVRERVGDLLPPLVERCFPLMSSMMVEREAYARVGGINSEIIYSHDYDLWVRLAARYPGALMAEPLIEYFSHAGSLSRRIAERACDDLDLMRRIERGDLGHRPELQRVAARRAAALEFDLAIHALRANRLAEGRVRLRRTAASGPWSRRLLALAAASLPAGAIPALMRSAWVKRFVQSQRRRAPVVRPGQGGAA
ncbi:MAG: glycosyltransferase family 2 protein [Candidatus Eisenbacteria bacterium]|nr:glycosyltransferase family 2 protein [Candidatus Eisenbacteria bacterium]